MGKGCAVNEEILTSPEGLRFRILRGTPEGDDVEVLGLALDRNAAWDQSHQPSTWVTASRPGIGLRAWKAGTRWSSSLRSGWEHDR
jgi:hypothetical protein